MPAKANNLSGGCIIQGKELRSPGPAVNLSSFLYQTVLNRTDFLDR